ncbi:hypothetical protein RIF29_38159 [Crotalaria pallida]|uniref:Uncharacterized protein n=1 Tax=Crotalaria pallida TaxID=3830 RepID=A0AAN9DZM3_CROPI
MDRLLLFIETLGKQVEALNTSNNEMKDTLNMIQANNGGKITAVGASTEPGKKVDLIRRDLEYDDTPGKGSTKPNDTLYYEIPDGDDDNQSDEDDDVVEIQMPDKKYVKKSQRPEPMTETKRAGNRVPKEGLGIAAASAKGKVYSIFPNSLLLIF